LSGGFVGGLRHHGEMAKRTLTRRVHLVEGRPWKDALIAFLEPRSPYRPWRTGAGIGPGDVVVATLGTEPRILLAAARIGADLDVGRALAAVDRRPERGLLNLADVEDAAGTTVPGEPGPLPDALGEHLVHALDGFIEDTRQDRLGHSSAAAARILLASDGECSGCGSPLKLRDKAARDEVHIRTLSADAAPIVDWPAALCSRCRRAMDRGGFTTFIEYRFALQPRCPRCSAQRTRSMVFGMPSRPPREFMPPWQRSMGCCRITASQWTCGDCEHQW
jgi:hypothetical protein